MVTRRSSPTKPPKQQKTTHTEIASCNTLCSLPPCTPRQKACVSAVCARPVRFPSFLFALLSTPAAVASHAKSAPEEERFRFKKSPPWKCTKKKEAPPTFFSPNRHTRHPPLLPRRGTFSSFATIHPSSLLTLRVLCLRRPPFFFWIPSVCCNRSWSPQRPLRDRDHFGARSLIGQPPTRNNRRSFALIQSPPRPHDAPHVQCSLVDRLPELPSDAVHHLNTISLPAFTSEPRTLKRSQQTVRPVDGPRGGRAPSEHLAAMERKRRPRLARSAVCLTSDPTPPFIANPTATTFFCIIPL